MQQNKTEFKKYTSSKKKLKKADAKHETSIFKDTVLSSLFSIIRATEKDWFQNNKKLKKLMQRTHHVFSKALSQAIYFQQSMQQKKAESKKTLGQKSLKPIQL